MASIVRRIIGRSPKPSVSIVRLQGLIGSAGPASPLRRGGLSLQRVAPALDKAFAVPGCRAVCLVINSPGGSPVQSSLISKRIRTLASEKNIPVLSFVEDIAASGGYWLACAGDEIYAENTSLVGSIGAIHASFGFSEIMKKLGIERRVFASGRSKNAMDPFEEQRPEDRKMMEEMLRDMHNTFVEYVKSRRGDKLVGAWDELFSGRVYTGNQSLKAGLIDGIDDLRSVVNRKFGTVVEVPVLEKTSLFASIMGGSEPIQGTSLLEQQNPLYLH